jgi:hypothetical protein
MSPSNHPEYTPHFSFFVGSVDVVVDVVVDTVGAGGGVVVVDTVGVVVVVAVATEPVVDVHVMVPELRMSE